MLFLGTNDILKMDSEALYTLFYVAKCLAEVTEESKRDGASCIRLSQYGFDGTVFRYYMSINLYFSLARPTRTSSSSRFPKDLLLFRDWAPLIDPYVNTYAHL